MNLTVSLAFMNLDIVVSKRAWLDIDRQGEPGRIVSSSQLSPSISRVEKKVSSVRLSVP
jgi:hypothetical protein